MNGADPQEFPLVMQLDSLELANWFRRWSCLPHCLFLDSALRHPQLGRYSFLAADPSVWYELPAREENGLAELQRRLAEWRTPDRPDLPPFQGGVAGVWGYELAHSLEHFEPARWNEFQFPGLAVGCYDVVCAIDHATEQAWLISQGFPEMDPAARRERAHDRLQQALAWSREDPTGANREVSQPDRLALDRLAPQHTLPGQQMLTSDFSSAGYREAVQRTIDYIHAGDVFQVNLSQRLLHPAVDQSADLYWRLRSRNPAPFAAYLDLGDHQVCSASPERFLQVRQRGEQRSVEARPIKGTEPRLPRPEADLFAGDLLRGRDKDRAENIMIVDLLRNDLARVCEPDSVRVSQLCGLESYAFVQHLVSVIRGELRAEFGPLDLLRASFPGGSITGAPKPRALQIISELEPTARGAYCGSLGYLGFNGHADTSILIRTITAGRGWWQLPVGGGVVADSDPQGEYDETWHKAKGMLGALTK